MTLPASPEPGTPTWTLPHDRSYANHPETYSD
jgi:hypothetical protein